MILQNFVYLLVWACCMCKSMLQPNQTTKYWGGESHVDIKTKLSSFIKHYLLSKRVSYMMDGCVIYGLK